MNHKTILAIEDSADTRLLLRQALKAEGYETLMASSGPEALQILREKALPDLILLDLSLPEMTGADFMKTLRENAEWMQIKVIIVSGWENLRTKALEIGANGAIRKPFGLNELYDELEKQLASY